MAGFIHSIKDNFCDEISYSSDQSYILLSDENGFISYATSNFQRTFLMSNIINFDEDKLNIEELFSNLH